MKLKDDSQIKGELRIGTGAYRDKNGVWKLKETWQEKQNTVLIGGSQYELEKLFNVRGSAGGVVPPPIPIGMDQIGSAIPAAELFPLEHHIYGFMVGNGGAGAALDKPATVDYRENKLTSAIPYIYKASNPDIPDPALRKYYGATSITAGGAATYAYFTKVFEELPIIHHIWKNTLTDDTMVEVDNTVWGNTDPYGIVSFIECHLRVEPTDFMDYFSDPAQVALSPMINELGLVAGMFESSNLHPNGGHDYKWHRLFTRLTFKTIFLDIDSPVGVDFIYRLYNKI
jgi:hypothetical protein